MKVLSSLLVIIISSGLYSQDTLFYTDFQDGTLGGMESVDNDGLLLDEEFMGFDPGYMATPISGPNSIEAVAVSSFQNGATADNWLISPQIQINQLSTTLSWFARSLSGDVARAETYKVMLSTTSDDLGDFTAQLTRINGESSQTTQHSYDLSAYVGQSVYIAFNQITTSGYALALDDILITEPSSPSAARLLRINGDRYQNVTQPLLFIEMMNTGSVPITELTVEGNINGQFGDFTFTELNIQPQETTEIYFGDLFPFTAQRHEIEARIIAVNGESTAGDTQKTTIQFVSDPPSRKYLMEESTGSWCGACPLGLVFKDIMKLKYRNEVIAVSVHNDDPMTNLVYDLGLNVQEGFMGVPSMTSNRSTFLEVDQIEEHFLNEFNDIAPMDLDMEHDYNDLTRQLSVTYNSEVHTKIEDDQYRYALIIIEDGVEGTDPAFAQSNDFSFEALDLFLEGIDGTNWQVLSDPVPASQMVYDDVARDLIGGFQGIEASILASEVGDQTSYEFDYILPSTFDENQIWLVGIVIDVETGEVVNANEIEMTFVSDVDELSYVEEVNIFPNPTSGSTSLSLVSEKSQPVMIELRDLSGKLVTTILDRLEEGDNNLIVDLAGTVPGVYSLYIRLDRGIVVRKIVVN